MNTYLFIAIIICIITIGVLVYLNIHNKKSETFSFLDKVTKLIKNSIPDKPDKPDKPNIPDVKIPPPNIESSIPDKPDIPDVKIPPPNIESSIPDKLNIESTSKSTETDNESSESDYESGASYNQNENKIIKCPSVPGVYKGETFEECCSCKCPPGYYLSGCKDENDTGKCLPYCEEGTYWDESKNICVKTPADTFIDSEGAYEPGPACPRAHYSVKGSISCVKCVRSEVKDEELVVGLHDEGTDCTRCEKWCQKPNDEGSECETIEPVAKYKPEPGICDLTQEQCINSEECRYVNGWHGDKQDIHSCIPITTDLIDPNICDEPEPEPEPGNVYIKYIILTVCILIPTVYLIKVLSKTKRSNRLLKKIK